MTRMFELLDPLEPRLLLSGVNFAPQVVYPTGSGAFGGIVADLNGDGIPDLVTTNYAANTISVLLGQGNGTFGLKTDFATGSGPTAVVAGDFNGDGHLDLAVVDTAGAKLNILLGDGKGGFAVADAAHTYNTGLDPVAIGAADFSGDGKLDLAVANQNANTISIFSGNGDGTFAAPVTIGGGVGPIALAAADLNGDGKPDLVVADFTSATVGVMLNNGSGAFPTTVNYGTGSAPRALAVADFNGDGILDLAVANSGAATVGLLLGTGAGQLAPMVSTAVGPEPFSLAVGDFNGDGLADLAVANLGNATVTVLANTGAGVFAPQVNFAAGNGPAFVLAPSLIPGDTRPDLVLGNSADATITVLTNAATPAGPVLQLNSAAQYQPFVTQLMQDLLGRTPQAGDVGLASFVAQLGQGVTPAQLATEIVNGQEYRQNLIQGLYQKLLNRQADSAGLANFMAVLAAGGTDEQVAAAIYGSAEYFALNGSSNVGFVFALYEDALGRVPDSSGLATFTNMLSAGATPLQVATLILQSTEYRQLTVTNLFEQILKRPPSATELATYLSQFAGGLPQEDIVTELVGTPGYYAVPPFAPTPLAPPFTPQGFLNQVYQNLLGRQADATALATWIPILNAQPGTAGQLAVVQAILASNEYRFDLVQSFYARFLHRAAGAQEAGFWVAQLNGGATDENVIANIVGSAEYFALHGSNDTSFLTAALHDMLQLPASAQAQLAITNQTALTNGATRVQVAQAFATGVNYWSTVLDLLYGKLLLRSPDAFGQATFITQKIAGTTDEQIAATLATSAEYVARS